MADVIAAVVPTAPVQNGSTGTEIPADAPKDGGTAAKAAEIRKFKLKVKGHEMELPETEVIARAQRTEHAAQELHQLRKDTEAKLGRYKNREQLWDALKDDGYTDEEILKLSASRVTREFDKSLLSKEQREVMEERRLREDAEKKLKTHEDRQNESRLKEATAKAQERYLDVFEKALSSVGVQVKDGDPLMAYAVSEMAKFEEANTSNDIGASPEILAQVVKDQMDSGVAIRFSGLISDPARGSDLLAQMEAILPGWTRAVAIAEIAKYEGAASPTKQPSRQRSDPAPREDDKPEFANRQAWRDSFSHLK